MPKDLLAENAMLQRQLKDLLEQGHRNEQIMRRHQMLDLQFIGAGSFRELIGNILRSFTDGSELDVVTLALLDPDYGIRRILVDLRIHLHDFPTLLFMENISEFGNLQDRLQKPVLGPYSEQLFGPMFPEPLPIPASVAAIPLRCHDRLIGCLALGSHQHARFTRNIATDFLEHQGSIIALCIENVINKELLKHIGWTDALTRVNNRRYIEHRLLTEIDRSCRHEDPLWCMYIDIDHFKQINDTVGHQGGDEVLREIAARIKAELRLSDALGRFGGEEFVALLISAESADARSVAERIRSSIAEQPLLLASGKSLAVTVSIGVATIDHADRSSTVEAKAEKLVVCADRALYQAKAEGRNRVVVYDGD